MVPGFIRRMVLRSSRVARELAWLLVAASALGALGWLWYCATRRATISFLPYQPPAEWIVAPSAPITGRRPRLEVPTMFERTLVVEPGAARARLGIAAMRRYSVAVNGVPLGQPARRGPNWKQPDSFELAGQVPVGTNEITVTVWDSNGPPALWFCLETGHQRVVSDTNWQVSWAGATPEPAQIAAEPKAVLPGGAAYGGQRVWASFLSCWPVLLVFAALAAAGCWALKWFWRGGGSDALAQDWRREVLVVGCVALVWLVVFGHNLRLLPPLTGFDVKGHISYIRYLQEHHRVPLAHEGWEMFQPPLYYAMCAGLLGLFGCEVTEVSGIAVLRGLGWAIGVAQVALVWASLRLLFPSQRSGRLCGLAMAGSLPPLFLLSQYVTNECLAATLASACIYVTLRALKQDAASWEFHALIGLFLGAAMLAKSTAVLLLPVVFGALLWKAWGLGQPESRWCWGRAGGMVLALGVCAAVAGWHYGRVWRHFGNPLIGNWDPKLPFQYWQDNGYGTSAYYLHFGQSLGYPWLSGFKSFGDGMYSTLWGDGMLSSAVRFQDRPPWNYDLMAVGYWLALLPTLLLLVGGLLAVWRFLRAPTAEWFLLLGLWFLTAMAVVYLSITAPHYSTKAFYALPALVTMCACAVVGWEFMGRNGAVRVGLGVLLAVWALNSFAGFWIVPGAAHTAFAQAVGLFGQQRFQEAADALRAGLDRHADDEDLQPLLAASLASAGDWAGAAREARASVERHPDNALAQLELAAALGELRQGQEAAPHARRATELAPGYGPAWDQWAMLLMQQHAYDQAIGAARDGLALFPFSAELRFCLGYALDLQGETGEAEQQLKLACKFKTEWPTPPMVLGDLLLRQSRPGEAVNYLAQAARLQPGNAQAHCELAMALGAQRQNASAVQHYTEALRIEPNLPEALNNLAWIRATEEKAELRDGAEAVRLAERACALSGRKEPGPMGTLAAAYAEAGRFEEAIMTAMQAKEMALAAGKNDLAEIDRKMLEAFKERRAWREESK